MAKSRKNKSPSAKVLGIIGRFLIFLLISLAFLLLAAVAACEVLFNGPSDTMKTLAVNSFYETSAMKWVPGLFLDDEEVEELLSKSEMATVDEGVYSDSSLINIPGKNSGNEEETDNEENSNTEEVSKDIELIEITGSSYKGYLLVISDPTRVFVGTVSTFYEGQGEKVLQMIERYNTELGYNIVAGVNGGEFYDAGSTAYTALPIGGVISEGEVVYGELNETYHLTGITDEGLLVIGNITLQEALDMGVKNAVNTLQETGPFLLMNGEIMTNDMPDSATYGGGKNPRTAIGQREDGAILLLVVDGRQANSLGATFKDLAYVMKEYGAVNACAMDGGTSAQMVYNGEVINNPYAPTGARQCPTAWLVQ